MEGNRKFWLRRLWPRHFLVQVTVLNSLLIALGIATLTAANIAKITAQQFRESEQRIDALATNLAIGSAQFILVRDYGAVEQLLLRAGDYPGVRSITITDAAHRIVSEVRRVADSPPQPTFNYKNIEAPSLGATQFLWRYGEGDVGAPYAMGLDATGLVVWHAIENGQLGWVRIDTSVAEIQANATRIIRDSGLNAVAMIGFILVALTRLLRPNLAALAKASHFADSLAHVRGQQLAVFDGSVELENLCRALNETSTRLYLQETAVAETNTLLTNVLAAASEVSIIATDSDGTIRLFNRGAEKLLGYSADETIGKCTPAIFHLTAEVESRGKLLTEQLGYPVAGFGVFVELPSKHGAQQSEWTYVRKSGEHVPVSLVVTPMRAPDGSITGYLGIAEDISERKRAENALRDAAEHTQTIINNMVDGLVTFDEHNLVTSFNPAAARMFGYLPTEVIGQHVGILIPQPLDTEPSPQGTPTLQIAGAVGGGAELDGRRKDGSMFPLEFALAEISRQGQPMYVAMVRDITERRRIDRMKSEFLSTVSHELRTPLTAISGALGLIASGSLGVVADKQRQLIDIAHKNSQRLSYLINDLLDMEKLVAGKMQFDLRLQQLTPLVEQSLDATRTYCTERRVSLTLNPGPQHIEVNVDSHRFLQIMSNLISNAIKYSPDGGEVEVSIEAREQRVRTSVADHGAGIPAEFRDRIFQKFSQADSSDTRRKGGTGLGLAITKELVERMGGTIGFESENGKGTRFYFDFPIVSSQMTGSMLASATATGDAPRILVLEDEPDIAQLLGLILERAGYSVDTAFTGAQALDAVKRGSYAAMIVDIALPDISGLDVIRRVRNDRETMDLPIIVVSAKMEEGKLAIGGDFLGIEWLAKPISQTGLLSALETHVFGPNALRPKILHIEDESDLSNVIRAMGGNRFDLTSATTLRDARVYLAEHRFDVIILDLMLPDGSGWQLLAEIRAQQPAARVIIFSALETATEDARKVDAVLLKSQVSPSQLLAAIGDRIRPVSGAGSAP